MITSNPHLAYLDTHRITPIMEYQDEASAPESMCNERFCCDSRCNQGRDCPAAPIKTVEEEFPLMWVLYGVAILLAIAGSAVAAYFDQLPVKP